MNPARVSPASLDPRSPNSKDQHAASGSSSRVRAIPLSAADGPTELLHTAQVAALLGFKVQSLRAMRLRGTGPMYIRLGGPNGRVVYRRSDIEEWLSGNRFASTSAERVARLVVPTRG